MLKATFREREQLIAHYEGELIPGPQGPAGPQGVGISTIEKTGTSGLVDTYTITLTNGDTTTFEVTNGEDGEVTTAAMNAAIEAALSAYSEGDYPDMQVGGLISDEYITDNAPYIFRPTAGGKKVGNREWNKLVGGTVAWNQYANNANPPSNRSGITFGTGADYFSMSGTTTEFLYAAGWFGQTASTMAGCVNHKMYVAFTLVSGTVSNTNELAFSVDGRGVNNVFLGTAKVVQYNTTATNSTITGTTAGTVFTNAHLTLTVVDLTQMFGSTIADYVYSLEQTTAGSGIAWLKKYNLIDDQYHAYSQGSLESVNVSAHVMVGKNMLGGETWADAVVSAVGNPTGASKSSDADGDFVSIAASTYTNNKPFTQGVKFKPNTQYTFIGKAKKSNTNVATNIAFLYTDGTIGYISFPSAPTVGTMYDIVVTSGPGKTIAAVQTIWGSGTTSFYYESCGLFEGVLTKDDFEPYTERTYPTDSSVTLRGIPKKDADGNLYYDGDTYEWDGTVTRKYAEVDLGSLSYTRYTSGSIAYFLSQSLVGSIYARVATEMPHLVCSKYVAINQQHASQLQNGTMFCLANGNFYIRDDAYSDKDAFKTAMNGVKLVYELAESAQTTESADPYTALQVCDPDGTEEWVDYGVSQGTRDYAVPVGHETNYIPDLSANTINDRITALEDGTYTPDNPTATTNVTSGKYFMVGSVLYKATASIAAGDKIVVGTNCTKPTIAEALNSLS